MFEDHGALDGGIQGIDLIMEMVINSPKIIKNKGFIIMEIAEY